MVLFSPPFREVSTFTRPGARWNEDAVGGGGSFLYVLDGATSLDAAPVMDPVSDAAWLVRETAGGWTAICRRRPAPWRTSLPRGWPGCWTSGAVPGPPSPRRGWRFSAGGAKGWSTLAWGTVPPASS